MNSRRSFVKKTALAAAGLMATRPLEALSSIYSLVIPGSGGFVLMYAVPGAEIPASAKASLLLGASPKTGDDKRFDVSYTELSGNQSGRIVVRNGKKVGVFAADETNADNVQTIAAELRASGAELVVCISGLGFKKDTGLDDRALANRSENIDIIISAHASNYPRHAVTVPNRVGAEVIIHSAMAAECGAASLSLGFDREGRKNSVAVRTEAA